VDAQDAAAVRRFDKQRPGRKTSNQEWVNPYDRDAKVSKAKDGATDMLYKPENIVDLDTGVFPAMPPYREASESCLSAWQWAKPLGSQPRIPHVFMRVMSAR
jgi:hypothetical protein